MIEFERHGAGKQVALIRLQRPDKANAYTEAMLEELDHVRTTLSRDATVRAVVITGAGDRVFCAGADRTELDARNGPDALDLKSRRFFDAWASAAWATVAAVNGVAAGGGFELALACDLRVCHPSARFFLPEVQLGLIPAAGGTRRLMAVVGEARTKDIILFGRELDASTALQWGIVSALDTDVVGRAITLAERAARCDPLAIRLAKGAIEATAQDVEGLSQALLYERRAARRNDERLGHT